MFGVMIVVILIVHRAVWLVIRAPSRMLVCALHTHTHIQLRIRASKLNWKSQLGVRPQKRARLPKKRQPIDQLASGEAKAAVPAVAAVLVAVAAALVVLVVQVALVVLAAAAATARVLSGRVHRSGANYSSI